VARTTLSSDGSSWILSPQTEEENDEQRVGYVAVIRPRKVLLLAVPDTSSLDGLEKHFDLIE